MQAPLETFKNNLIGIKEYINYLIKEDDLLSKGISVDERALSKEILIEISNNRWQISTQRKQLNYTSLIIALYGSLERFIEELIAIYIRGLNQAILNYQKIPAHIEKNHLRFSLEILNKIEYSKYQKTDEKNLISNLNSCYNDQANYKLNDIAFAYHNANFRLNIIQECFTRIGISNIAANILNDSNFKEYLEGYEPDIVRIDTITYQEKAFSKLDDLVERRNELAHGTPSDLLSPSYILQYIDFLSAFGQSLWKITFENLLIHEVENRAIELGNPIEVWNNNIVGINLTNLSIQVGDTLVTRNPRGKYRSGKIQELRINETSYQELHLDNKGNDVAIRVDFKVKNAYTVFLLPKNILVS